MKRNPLFLAVTVSLLSAGVARAAELWIGEAVAKNVITSDEANLMREAEDLMQRVIAVDHFDPEELKPHYRLLSNSTQGIGGKSVAGARAAE